MVVLGVVWVVLGVVFLAQVPAVALPLLLPVLKPPPGPPKPPPGPPKPPEPLRIDIKINISINLISFLSVRSVRPLRGRTENQSN